MTFSIVIPAYNGEAFIEETILSAITQKRKADEIIVYDDGSTDRTSEICNKFSDKIKYIHNEKGPSGFVNGWNKAIQHSSCEYISVLHQDDILYSTFIQQAEIALNANPQIRHLFCLNNYINEGSEVITQSNEVIKKYSCQEEYFILSGTEYVKAYQHKYEKITRIHRCPGVITHRSIFFNEKCNYSAAAGHIADDDFFYRVGQYTDTICVLKSLSAYRLHSQSETGSLSNINLIRRLSNDYIYQILQWKDSNFMTNVQKQNFESWAFKFTIQLLIFSSENKSSNDWKTAKENFMFLLTTKLNKIYLLKKTYLILIRYFSNTFRFVAKLK